MIENIKEDKNMLTKQRSFLVMLTFLFTLLFAGAVSAAELKDEIQSDTLHFQGIERTFDYYVPTSYTGKKKVPLMLSFHGRGSNSEGQINLSGYEKVAEKEGFIVVFPNSTVIFEDGVPAGHERQWNDGRIDTPAYRAGIDDVGFTSALIDYFIDNFNIDVSRVYATGMSNGSFFSNRLAVELSDRIAGIGAVTGPLAAPIALKTPKNPVSVVLVMGDQDPIVSYDGYPGYMLSAQETINYWVKANEIRGNGKPKVNYLPQTAENDQTKIRREAYNGGKHGTEVILYKVEGGGHTWPDGPQYANPELIGYTSYHMNASEVIWNELKTHKNNHVKQYVKQ